jgi:hypothetical protein
MKARAILRTSPVALLVLVAVLAAVWAVNRPAGAQTTEEAVGILNLGVDPDSNGYATLDFRDPAVISVLATCGGAYPQGGTSQIPSQVMARRPFADPRIIRLRLVNPSGHPVTAAVRVNCTLDVRFTTPTTPTALRERLAKVLHQVEVG